MKFKDTGFRAVYHNFCVFELNDTIKKVIADLPGQEEANGVLTYGYYDREAGLTLEILAAAKFDDEHSQYASGNSDISLKLRIGSVEDIEFFVLTDDNGELTEAFADKLEMLETYDTSMDFIGKRDTSEDILKTREMKFLDPFRHDYFIDDIQVDLMKDELQTERCWARIVGLGDYWIMGRLLNEPYQNFGWHEGELISFFIEEDENGDLTCFTDMNPSKKVTREDLEGGLMLKEAVATFSNERNEPNFLDVLEILRDSFVWVPCAAAFSDEDKARVEKQIKENEDISSLKGQKLDINDKVRLLPDILQNGDKYFFPIFSNEEEMGEYGKDFSKVEMHMLDALHFAKNHVKDLSGIVLNAFTEPFVLETTIFDIFDGMKSRIDEN